MSDKRSRIGDPPTADCRLPTREYDLLDLLDRLESLAEDMDDLHVHTRDDVEKLIATIHARLDTMEAQQSSEFEVRGSK